MSKRVIKKYYTKFALGEWKRLIKDAYKLLEFDTSMHFLKKYLPKKRLILDAGGGPGRYTIALAKRGYDVVLFDLTPQLLKIASYQIQKNRIKNKVKQIVNGSIDNLSMFKNNTFDATICLGGTLNHFINKRAREKAVRELIRVTKTNAPIFVSVIGRIALCMNSINYLWAEMLKAPDIYRKYTVKGDYFGGFGFAPAHFYLPEELEKEFGSKTKIIKMIGLEGIFSSHRQRYNKVYKLKKYNKILWETHLKTCTSRAL